MNPIDFGFRSCLGHVALEPQVVVAGLVDERVACNVLLFTYVVADGDALGRAVNVDVNDRLVAVIIFVESAASENTVIVHAHRLDGQQAVLFREIKSFASADDRRSLRDDLRAVVPHVDGVVVQVLPDALQLHPSAGFSLFNVRFCSVRLFGGRRAADGRRLPFFTLAFVVIVVVIVARLIS